MVREPAERALSMFQYMRDTRGALPRDLTFPELVSACRSGSTFAGNQQLSELLEHGHYVRYLRPWRDALPAESLKVVTVDRLVHDSFECMQEICTWLGIENTYVNYDFSSRNESVALRSRSLERLKTRLSNSINTPTLKRVLRPAYRKLNLHQAGRAESNSKLGLHNLKLEYASSNQALWTEFGISFDEPSG